MSRASELLASIPGGRGYEDRVEQILQSMLNQIDSLVDAAERLTDENEVLRLALAQMVSDCDEYSGSPLNSTMRHARSVLNPTGDAS